MEQKYTSCDFSLLTSAVVFMGTNQLFANIVLRYDKYCDVRMGVVRNCSPAIHTDVMMTKPVYQKAVLGSSQIGCETG